jgi:hydrogenase expression/formation protein HypC
VCLGIPARVVSPGTDVVLADVAGTVRPIGTGLLDDDVRLAAGDWVLVHMGFALERLSESEADQALASLDRLGAEPVIPDVPMDARGAPAEWASW